MKNNEHGLKPYNVSKGNIGETIFVESKLGKDFYTARILSITQANTSYTVSLDVGKNDPITFTTQTASFFHYDPNYPHI